MTHCDCAYIAPEVLASGHRCNQCRAMIETISALEEVVDRLEYLDAKGWKVFTCLPRVHSLIQDLRLTLSGKGPAKKSTLTIVKGGS